MDPKNVENHQLLLITIEFMLCLMQFPNFIPDKTVFKLKNNSETLTSLFIQLFLSHFAAPDHAQSIENIFSLICSKNQSVNEISNSFCHELINILCRDLALKFSNNEDDLIPELGEDNVEEEYVDINSISLNDTEVFALPPSGSWINLFEKVIVFLSEFNSNNNDCENSSTSCALISALSALNNSILVFAEESKAEYASIFKLLLLVLSNASKHADEEERVVLACLIPIKSLFALSSGSNVNELVC